MLDRLRGDGDEVRERLDRHQERFGRHKARLDKLSERLTRTRQRVDQALAGVRDVKNSLARFDERLVRQRAVLQQVQDALKPLEHDSRQREVDYLRSLQQLAALEERVGRLEERLEGDRYDADDASLAQARSLVDTVRREHDQARVRFQIISAYEERMRRLEAAVIDLYDGDVRHPL